MRLAIRSLRRRPAFALTAILTVAVGIGANAALFGVIYSVLLRPLPYPNPDRLVQIWETHPTLHQLQVTVPDFNDWRTQSRSFEQLAAYTFAAMNNATLLGQGDPAPVHASMATSSLFPTLGIQPLLGIPFTTTEEAGKQRVAMISEHLWRSKFAADPAVVGKQIRIDAESFRVAGVVSREQAFPPWADLWIPMSLIEPELGTRRKYHPLEVVARMKPGVKLEQAQSEMQILARRLAQAHPDTNRTVGSDVIPLMQQITGAVRPSLLLVWAAVGLVLLIACANLAHLFIGRTLERRHDIAVREALGARAGHLIRQLLSESLLIAAIGGAAGFALAVWANQIAAAVAGDRIPRFEWTGIAGPVMLFAVAASLIFGIVFGLPACWQVLRTREQLGESGRSVTRARSPLSAIFLAAEIALALLVLTGSVLLTRSFAALLDQSPGFQSTGVWTIPNMALGDSWPKSAQFFNACLAPALRAVPGVQDVAAANAAPMSLAPTELMRFATRFGIEGRTFDPGHYPVAQNRWITPEYFRVLGVPLKSGRWLSEDDRNRSNVVINEALARRFFPGQNAVGRRLVLGVMDPQQTIVDIVGVAGDLREFGLDQEPEPTLYGVTTAPVMTLLVKTKPGANPAAALRDAIHSTGPEIAIPKIAPLDDNLAESLAGRRLALSLLAVFGALAAFLTAGGVYGLMTQSVTARIREFGIRAAIGAWPHELVRMVLREAILLAIPGILAGALLSVAFGRLMKSFVYQVSPLDPVSIAAAALLLTFVTLASAWLPARRASTVDPMIALRSE